MSFENQKTDTSREAFENDESRVAQAKEEIAKAAAVGDFGKVAELAGQAKDIESTKTERLGATEEEATAENAERDMAAKKESDHAEALEMNQAFDESKAAEAAAKEKARLAEEGRVQAESDASAAAKLAEQIKGGNIRISTEKNGDAVEVENKNETRSVNYPQMKQSLLGEAEVALSAGDMHGFQNAYVKMAENDLAELQSRIQRSNAFEKKTFLEKIEELQSSIEILKNNPQAVSMRKNFNEGLSKVDVLENILAEAESTIRRERKSYGDGVLYENAAIDASSKMEGAVRAALQYKDPKVVVFLKETFGDVLPTTTVRLSPELQQQIHDLKV